MRLRLIGLGRMGANMARRLWRHAHHLVVFDLRPATRNALASEIGAVAAEDLEDLVRKLEPPRIVWLMLPAGQVTEDTPVALMALLTKGDTLVDGANSFYKDSIEQGIPAPVMSLALMMRFATQGHNDYSAKLLAMMRKGFGGHAIAP